MRAEIASRKACSAGSDMTASPTQLVARTRDSPDTSPYYNGTANSDCEWVSSTHAKNWSKRGGNGETPGKTVVFTNGCYDILHPGHIRLLEQARSLGDF